MQQLGAPAQSRASESTKGGSWNPCSPIGCTYMGFRVFWEGVRKEG